MNPKETTEYIMSEISQLTAWQAKSNAFIDKLGQENELQKEKYITLRAAAIMFLEAQKKYDKWIDDRSTDWDKIRELGDRLDAARSVLWDVINDKDLTK